MTLQAVYFVTALVCSSEGCARQMMWTGTDRNQCQAQAVQLAVNPPYGKTVKFPTCNVERARPGYEWAEQGYWRKVRQ